MRCMAGSEHQFPGLHCVWTQSSMLTGLCLALQYKERLNALYEGQLDSEMVAAQARRMGAEEQARKTPSKTSKKSRKGRRRGSDENEAAERVGSNINSGQMAAMMRIMEQQR